MTLNVQTPIYGGTYDLSLEGGKVAFWKQILPERQIHYTTPDGRRAALNFNRQYLADLATNVAVDKIGFLLADKDNRHTMDPERWRGNVEQMEVRENQPDPRHNGLWGKIVFPSKEAAQAILDNPDLGVSARIRENIPKSDGSVVNRGIIHVLGTLDPQVNDMAPWVPADLSASTEDVLDLSNATYDDEDKTMPKTVGYDSDKDVLDYTDEDFVAMSDEEMESYFSDCADALGVSLEEFTAGLDEADEADDEDEDDPDDEDIIEATASEGREPEMALSNEVQAQIDLANDRAGEALRRLAEVSWQKERDAYLGAGVPAYLLDLAKPVLNQPDEFVVDLSNSGEDDINMSAIVRGLLDAAKGTVDLSTEMGHGGTFSIGSGEDPDADMLALWNAQN